jgi:hypothetical protein
MNRSYFGSFREVVLGLTKIGCQSPSVAPGDTSRLRNACFLNWLLHAGSWIAILASKTMPVNPRTLPAPDTDVQNNSATQDQATTRSAARRAATL